MQSSERASKYAIEVVSVFLLKPWGKLRALRNSLCYIPLAVAVWPQNLSMAG